jgi:hypothetical protein
MAPIALTAAYRREWAPRPMPERITQRESAAYVAAGGSDTAGNDGMRLRCGRPGCLRELVSSPGNLRARAYGVTGSAARYRPIAFPKAC